MDDLRNLIANAKKNIPPLKKENHCKEIILIDSKNSIFDKLIQNRKNNHDVSIDDEAKKPSIKNWIQLKKKFFHEMEEKRNLEWEQQKNLIKLDDEEEYNDVEFLDEITKSNEGDDNDIENDKESQNLESSQNQQKDNKENDDEDDDNEDDDDDNIENGNESQDLELRPNQSENYADSDDDDDLFIKKKHKVISIENSDDDNDNNENNSDILKISFSENDTNTPDEIYFNDENDKFISQHLPLTPIFTPNEVQNKNEKYDSQMLLELCSGKFNNDENSNHSENSIYNQEKEEKEKIDEDDNVNELKYDMPMKGKDFIVDEAELSGDEDDVSSDESENDENEPEFLEDLIQDGFSDEGLKEQVEKIHNKNMLDEDKRQIMILKEYFFEDGDLHDDTNDRKKKFKWNLDNNEKDFADWVNTINDSDSDSNSNNDDDDEDDDRNQMIRFKRPIEQMDNESYKEDNLKKIRSTVNQKLLVEKRSKKHQSSLKSFVICDKQLREVMKNSNSYEFSKKKSNSNDSLSIFDVI